MILGDFKIVPLNDDSFSTEGTKTKRKKQKILHTNIDLMNAECLLGNLITRRANVDIKGQKEHFLSHIFQKRPMVVRGNEDILVVVKQLLFDFEVAELIKNSASDQIHVWLSYHASDGQGMESISIEDPNQAMKLYHAGHSLYCRAPRELETSVVPRLLSSLGLGLVGSSSDKFRRGEIEMFFSRQGHVTDFHTDFQENFTIQLTGKKRWIFRSSTATHPLRGCTPHYRALSAVDDVSEQQLKALRLGDAGFSADQYRSLPRSTTTAAASRPSSSSSSSSSSGKGKGKIIHGDRSNVVPTDDGTYEVELAPGDVLYHPAGVWHRVECLEDSLSINVSLICASYAEVFCSGLQQLLWQTSPAFRDIVVGGSQGRRVQSLGVMQEILSSLPGLLRSLHAEDFIPLPCSGINADYNAAEERKKEGDERDSVKKNKQEMSHDDNDDEEEGEEEEEEEAFEDSDANADETSAIRVADVMVPSMDGATMVDDGGSRATGAARARAATTETARCARLEQLQFRVNPLVQIVSQDDLDKFKQSDAAAATADTLLCRKRTRNDSDEGDKDGDVMYVCHSSFGNEAMESLLRQCILVPCDLVANADKMINLIQFHRTTLSHRQLPLPLVSNAPHSNDHEDLNIYVNIAQIRLGLSKHPQSTELLAQLLFAFVQAGALTLAS